MQQDWRDIQTADGAFRAYVVQPDQPARGAVVAIQEIFGVNEVMRHKCEWLARSGFIAICPDLFWRLEPGVELTDKSEAEWSKAFDLMKRFDADQGVEDIAATLAFARGALGAGKVGAVGYCLGGLLAYLTACRTDADASVGYYGVSIEQRLDEADKLARPLMLHIARKDQFVPPDAQAQIDNGLKNHPQVSLFFYDDQDHAFTREGGVHFDAAAAKLADERTIAFFKQHLA